MRKRFLSLALAALMVFSLLPFGASAAADSGVCGDNLTWTYENGVLTISGTGSMWDYGNDTFDKENRPSYRSCIPYVTKLVVEEGVTAIGENAFYRTNHLDSVSLPDSLTKIGGNAFYACTNLKRCFFPINLDEIQYKAFAECYMLETVTIPSSVTKISENAFSNCKGLKTIVFLGDAPSVTWCSFMYVTAEVYYPASRSSWDTSANHDFGGTLTWTPVRDCGYCGPENADLSVIWLLDDSGVLTVRGSGAMTDYSAGASPFYGNTDMTKAVIESGVTRIGAYAFEGCANLAEVTIPEGVTSIGAHAFDSCRMYKAIVLPGTLEDIGEYAFYSCGASASAGGRLVIPTGVTNVGKYAFANCRGIMKVTLPKTLNVIPEGMFNQCVMVDSVTIPYGITEIGAKAFQLCGYLRSIKIPDSVTSIGFDAFTGCEFYDVYYTGTQEQWKKISFHDNWQITGTHIHYNSASAVASGKCGEAVTWKQYENARLVISGSGAMTDYSAGTSPFCGNADIAAVVIESGVTSIGACAFEGCTKLAEVTIPESVTGIGASAFSGCAALNGITAGGDIGDRAFENCTALQRVTMTGGTRIGDSAFSGCAALAEADLPATLAEIGENAFLGANALATVHFAGKASQWNALSVAEAGNDPLQQAEVTFGAEDDFAILRQPKRFYGHPGDPAAFTVAAVGEGLRYQWYYSDNGGETWGRSGSTGWNTDTLQPVLRANNSGRLFKCVITDAAGNTVETRPAVMALASTEVTIVAQPENYVGKVNDSAVFHVEAEGENLTYLWYYRDSEDAAWTQSWGTGYNTDTLTTALRAYRDGRQFRCEVKSGGTNTVYTEPVTMTLAKSDVVIVSQPADVTAKAMSLNAFHVDAEGENLTFRWYVKQGADAEWEPSFNDGYNTDTLNVRLYEYRDGYQYKCEIQSGGTNAAFTEAVSLRMIPKTAKITAQPERVCTEPGQTVTFHVGATGETLTYQWQFRKTAEDAWVNTGMTGNQTDTLTVVAIAARNGYQFRCAVTDSSGSVTYTTAADLKIGALPKLLTQPQDYTGAAASTAVFSVEAEGEGLTYQWYYKDASGFWSPSGAADAQSAVFSVAVLSYRDGYQYRCAVTNAEGLTVYTDAVTLTVQ